MSTGYSWEGIRQVRATLLGAHYVPERLCGGYVYSSVRPLPLPFMTSWIFVFKQKLFTLVNIVSRMIQ